jgi:hypothetical protein
MMETVLTPSWATHVLHSTVRKRISERQLRVHKVVRLSRFSKKQTDERVKQAGGNKERKEGPPE